MNSSTTHSILKRDWKHTHLKWAYSHKSQMTRQSTVRFAFSTRHKSKSGRHIEIKLILLTKGMRVQGREIKFGDKKWSKKEIANKYINKTASVSRDGHAQTRKQREQKNKTENFKSEMPTSRFRICYIASHTHWEGMYVLLWSECVNDGESGESEKWENGQNTADRDRHRESQREREGRKTDRDSCKKSVRLQQYSVPSSTGFVVGDANLINLKSTAFPSLIIAPPISRCRGFPRSFLLFSHRICHSAAHASSDGNHEPEKGPVQVLSQFLHRCQPRPSKQNIVSI